MSSNQRPDTLTQDRITNRRNLLAPHGRTIHLGHSWLFGAGGKIEKRMFAANGG